MSQGNIQNELQYGEFASTGKVCPMYPREDQTGAGYRFGWGLTADLPADGALGYAPGCLWHDTTTGLWYKNIGSIASAAFRGMAPVYMGTAVGGALSAGDVAPWVLARQAGQIVGAGAVLKTASTSGAVTLDWQKSSNNGTGWTTVFTTKLTIDQDERSSESAAVACVLLLEDYVAGDLLRVYVDDAGTGAADLSAFLWCAEGGI